MQLEYYYLVFEEDTERCPKQLFESILKRLSVVFSVYGFSKALSDTHELHAICEDNKRLTLYESLPGNVKSKLRQKRKDLKDLKSFTKFIMPVLLREEGLCIEDNTIAFFDVDDDDD